MKAEVLRKSILQMAIQGKLVPQNSSDEPASVLLQKIRAEKEKLMKEGKIKRDKTDSVIFKGEDGKFYEKIGKEVKDITEDVDFELPQGWELIRLSNIAELGSGFTPKLSELSNKGEVPYFKVSDMNTEGNEKYLMTSNLYYVGDQGKIWDSGTIVFPKNGGAVFTNKKRILIKKSVVDLNTGTFKPSNYIYFGYAYLVFQSIDFRKHFKGTALPTINSNFMNNLLFGLPPYEEQKRIVEAIEKFEPLLAEYDKLEQQAEKLDGEIFDKLKKSILQYAIQGKLVPQDSSDEPASVLLSKIKAEKEKLINEGKIKKENPLPPITDSEKPFDIPDSWQWVRLGELAAYKKGPFGSSLTKSMFVPKSNESIKVYEQKNAIYKNCMIGNYYISNKKFLSMKSFEVFPGEIIVSCAGTIGETFVLPKNAPKGIINQALMKVKLYLQDIVDFYLLYFDYVLKKEATNSSKGSAIKNIPPFDVLKKMILPLPPLNEQKRIVARIEQLFAEIDKIKAKTY